MIARWSPTVVRGQFCPKSRAVRSMTSSLTPIRKTRLWAGALQHATRLRVQVAECHALDPLIVLATLRLVEPFQDLSRWPLPFPILPLRMRRRWSGLGCIAKPAGNGAGMHALSPIKPVRTRLPALARRCLWNRMPRTFPSTSPALESCSPFIAVTTSSTRQLSANRRSAQTVSTKFSPRNRKPFAPTSTLAGAAWGALAGPGQLHFEGSFHGRLSRQAARQPTICHFRVIGRSWSR
ncbi:hypothetical protein MAA5396_05030 [Marinovum algicola]|uniref:Uncharacterized protein n=1 Tax=Marinovum algicola TaxID=42444 RepID=A0A975WES8_9RHOB|nr:hypothetical protein SAMN04487940_12739 [Marinovum algicola]SLN77510.1 hypothetical protein MAA5396_05030 [Marinovum algicola]